MADVDICLFFFFNDTATTEIYTLSLHDALPISIRNVNRCLSSSGRTRDASAPMASRIVASKRSSTCVKTRTASTPRCRSEEHTSELQSQSNLVCRLLLEKKKPSRHGARPLRHSV